MTSWDEIREVLLGYPHARAIGADEVQIAFRHIEIDVGVHVLHRAPAVLLVAELGAFGAIEPLAALRFNMVAAQRIAVIGDHYVLRDDLMVADADALDRQITVFVRTAAALQRRRRGARRDLAAFAFAV